MAGYVRQSASLIQPDEAVTAAIFNAEFDAIQAAFGGSSGHAHSGGIGDGKRINYSDIDNRPTVLTLTSTAPSALNSSAVVGSSNEAARADHRHIYPTPAQIGAATSGHTHSNATTSVAGFMSAADKDKLDTIPTPTSIGTVRQVQAGTGMSFSTITGIGAVNIDTTVVPRLTNDNNFANHLMQNMIIIGEGFPVIAKGTVSGSVSCDLSTGSFFTMTVGASTTQVTFTNAKSGRAHVAYIAVTFTSSPTFSITGDLTKGSPAPFAFSSTSANSQSWSTSGTDLLMCITFNGGSSWYVIRLAASPT